MKKNIVFISAVKREKTPVLVNMLKCFDNDYNLILIEYTHKEILSFLKKSLYAIFQTKNTVSIIFIGIQSLPILFLVQFLGIQKYYWALENYEFKFFNSSFVQKTLFLEYLIYWKKIILIVPSKYRADFYKSRYYKKTIIIENTPLLGNKFKVRLLQSEKVKFVMYGRLCNDDIYLKEFINVIGKFHRLAELHLIGWDFLLHDKIDQYNNIFYHGPKKHSDLISSLDEFHVSIIGYRPYKFNNMYCAPNKLFEAFSISLPVFANELNPPLLDIITAYKCGILVDFNILEESFEIQIKELRQNYNQYSTACYDAYTNHFYFENYLDQIAIETT